MSDLQPIADLIADRIGRMIHEAKCQELKEYRENFIKDRGITSIDHIEDFLKDIVTDARENLTDELKYIQNSESSEACESIIDYCETCINDLDEVKDFHFEIRSINRKYNNLHQLASEAFSNKSTE